MAALAFDTFFRIKKFCFGKSIKLIKMLHFLLCVWVEYNLNFRRMTYNSVLFFALQMAEKFQKRSVVNKILT